jgi:hypothetical protein
MMILLCLHFATINAFIFTNEGVLELPPILLGALSSCCNRLKYFKSK